MGKQIKTSWEDSSKWYDVVVGEKGHYYHENVILPRLLKILKLGEGDKFLDLACGQGVLEREIPPNVSYMGVDISESLIRSAKERCRSKKHQFIVGDATKSLPVPKDFTHAAIILALQNMEDPSAALRNVSEHMAANGLLCLVLNHPSFRIPRLSHWGIDEGKKLQYRRLDSYLTSQKIPIQTHPGMQKTVTTWTFHHPISAYSKWLKEAGFMIAEIEEWTSDKESTGGKARMENRARKEFPLFCTLICRKVS